MERYTLIDLFAGCGGMSRGFEASRRFRSILAVEADADAAETYRRNFGDHVAEARIEDVASFPSADVLIGGPPARGSRRSTAARSASSAGGSGRSTCGHSNRPSPAPS